MPVSSSFRDTQHNHKRCVQKAVDKAVAHCETKQIRFTPIRKRVFELVWASHAPIVAYRLLKRLREEKDNAEAPTVYRSLDFLLEHDLIHKIESLNAFVGCEHPGEKHISQFLICTDCQQVAELENRKVARTIDDQAQKFGFDISHQTIEIMGLCPQCQV